MDENNYHDIHSMDHEDKPRFLDILVLILSVYVLIALMVDTFMKLPPEISHIIHILDELICFVFLADFVIRFRRAKNKWKFMRWGWIDLISSIPTFDFMRVGRALRLFRLIRIVRAFRSTRVLVNYVFKRRKHRAMASVIIIAILMVIFSSISILQVEHAPNSNIKTAEDALWWSYVTITTVGYGDYYPVTTAGKLIGAVLMTVGVGTFGIFTAFLAAWFLGEAHEEHARAQHNAEMAKQKEEKEEEELRKSIKDVQKEL